MSKSCNKVEGIRYDRYTFSGKDWLEYGFQMLLKGLMICYLFYDSYKMCFLLLPFGVLDYRAMKKQKLRLRQRNLVLQFRGFMEAIANGMSAGYSLERAVMEGRQDLKMIYPYDADIFRELDAMETGLQLNVPVEQLFQSFGVRSGIDDISNFANVVTVAKRNGGNMVHIIRKTVNSIGDKLAVEEEIAIMIAAKKYEEKIMMLMPYGIILYLRLTNDGFFDILYHNPLGILLMTVFLAGVYLADLWARKIMEIRV